MSFGNKLALCICAAVLLELVPLGLLLRGTNSDLATGQLIGVFVLIALAACLIVGLRGISIFKLRITPASSGMQSAQFSTRPWFLRTFLIWLDLPRGLTILQSVGIGAISLVFHKESS